MWSINSCCLWSRQTKKEQSQMKWLEIKRLEKTSHFFRIIFKNYIKDMHKIEP